MLLPLHLQADGRIMQPPGGRGKNPSIGDIKTVMNKNCMRSFSIEQSHALSFLLEKKNFDCTKGYAVIMVMELFLNFCELISV